MFLGFLDLKAQSNETQKVKRLWMGLTSEAISVKRPLGSVSGGERQGVAIDRAFYFNADLTIPDEANMGLSITETDRVLQSEGRRQKLIKTAAALDDSGIASQP